MRVWPAGLVTWLAAKGSAYGAAGAWVVVDYERVIVEDAILMLLLAE